MPIRRTALTRPRPVHTTAANTAAASTAAAYLAPARLAPALLALAALALATALTVQAAGAFSGGSIPIAGAVDWTDGTAGSSKPAAAAPSVRVELLALPLAYEAATLAPETGSGNAEPGDAGDRSERPAAVTATPKGDGTFRLTAPEAGLWNVRVRVEGRVPWECPLAPLTAPVLLPLVRPAADLGLTVRVESADGEPVAGARVLAEFAPSEPAILPCRPASRTAVTGEDGTATLPHAQGEELLVAAAAAGHAPSPWTPYPGPAGRSEPFVLRLPAGRPLVLAVRERAGDPAEPPTEARPAAGIVARAAESGLALAAGGERGQIELVVPTAGPLEVELLAADGRLLRLHLDPPPAGGEPPPPRVVELAAATPVSGRVLADDTGKPLAGALVGLAITPEGMREAMPSAPVPGNRFGWAWEPLALARTGEDGRYSLPAAAALASPDALASLAASQTPAERPAEVERWATAALFDLAAEVLAPGGSPPEPDVRLHRVGVASGVVVDEAGTPVEDAVVLAGDENPTLRTVSSRGGGFALYGLSPGQTYRLRAVHPGFAAGEAPAELPSGASGRPSILRDVRLVLSRGLAAGGRVEDEAGLPIEGARALLLPPGAGLSIDLFGELIRQRVEDRLPRSTSDADGDFRFSGIDPGRYDLLVGATGHAHLRVPGIEIAADLASEGATGNGGTADLGTVDLGTVVLSPEVALRGRVVDPDHRPVPGAQVTPSDFGRLVLGMIEPEVFGADAIVETGAEGEFAVTGTFAGQSIDLAVERDGFRTRYLSGLTVLAGETLEVVLQPLSAVAGRVVDARGRPVEGARVALTPATGEPPPVESDGQGRFLLDGVAAGDRRLAAWADGFGRTLTEPLELPAGATLDDVEIVLEPEATLDGRVRGAAGAPVADLWATVVAGGGLDGSQHDDRRQDGPPSQTRTDDEGRFRFDSLLPGPLSLSLYSRKSGRIVRDVALEPGNNRVEIDLPAAPERHRVSGHVLYVDGEPAAQASVELSPVDGGGVAVRSLQSADDGSFSFLGATDGLYRIEASHPDVYRDGVSATVRVVGGPVEGIELTLPTAAHVSGRVLGLSFDELARVEVSARSAAGAARETYPAHDGAYRIGPLVPGVWEIDAHLDFAAKARGTVEILPGQTAALLDLDFDRGHTLSGRVSEDGEPVAGADLYLGCSSVRGQVTDTDLEGRFRLSGLDTADCWLVVRLRDELIDRRDLEIDGDREIEIEIERAALTGRTISADDGTPAPGVRLELRAAAELAGSFGRILASTVSGGDGGFRFRNAPTGRWQLHASGDGWASTATTVDVEAGTATGPVEIALEPAPELVLEVRLPSGRPPGSVHVALLDAAGEPFWAGDPAVGEGGRVRLSTAAAGAHQALVGAYGYGTAQLPVRVPGPPVALTLPPAGYLLIRVPELIAEAAAAASPPPARARLLAADGRPVTILTLAGFPQREWPLRSGAAYIEGIAPGSYRVVVESADGRRWAATAAVGAGADSTVEAR